MTKNKIKRYLETILVPLIITICIFSCSNEYVMDSDINEGKDKIYLAISLSSSDKEETSENETRSTGTPDNSAESKIYSLVVLVFKSDNGVLDGYKSIPRKIDVLTGTGYEEIDEVKGVALTAGTREIYVVANAPDNYFSSISNIGVSTITDFKNAYENLSTQGQYANLGETNTEDPDLPIGGVAPSDWKTNLTMCGYNQVVCSAQDEQQYLGYTANGGRPDGVSDGYVLNGMNPFYLERLVARVAFKKITFALPSQLQFEAGYPTNVYEYALDSIFLLNAKTASYFVSKDNIPLAGNFGHGNNNGYRFLQNSFSNISTGSIFTDYLEEPINSSSYDIESNHSPLWFYVFENDVQAPTYFVISVRYDFISTLDDKAKTVKYYYPVVINANGIANGANHNYIRRNYQYGITAVIRNLGVFYDENTIEELRSASTMKRISVPSIEVEETIGRNLFSWTSNIYK